MRAKPPAYMTSAPEQETLLPVLAPCCGVTAVSTTTAVARDRRMCSAMCACTATSDQLHDMRLPQATLCMMHPQIVS